MSDLLRTPFPNPGFNPPPVEIRAAILAFEGGVASSQQQRRLWRFIIDELCCLKRIELTFPAETSVQNWRAGRRYVGAYLEDVRTSPMDGPAPPEPPAVTMTQKAQRRNRVGRS